METVHTVSTQQTENRYRDMERPRRCDEHPEARPTNVPYNEASYQ